MIEKTNLARVRMMNFYQAMDDVITYLNKEDLETLKLKDPVKAFSDKFSDFDKIIQPMRESGLAKSLLELDNRRDKALGLLSTHLRLFSDYPEADKAKAAQELLLIYPAESIARNGWDSEYIVRLDAKNVRKSWSERNTGTGAYPAGSAQRALSGTPSRESMSLSAFTDRPITACGSP